MKGMQKISRGSSFGGVMAYAFDGDLDNQREMEGEVVGGNMSGHDPKSLTREFNVTKAIRPDVEKPVWHNSLRLTKDEKLTHEQWADIGDAYMKKMGFSDNHMRVYVLHDDKNGQHIHIIASRIGLDGKLFLGKNENFASTKIINGLEKEFGLVPTKGADYDAKGKVIMPSASRARKDEIEKAVRTNVEPVRYQLQTMIDRAMMDKPSVTTFVERLQIAGVDVVPNIASTGKLNGFSFGLDGLHYSGSKLGDKYKQSSLEKRGLTYDKDRESAFLEKLRESSRNHANTDGRGTNIEKPESSGDRAINGEHEAHGSRVRGSDRTGTDRADDRIDERDHPGAGRGDTSRTDDAAIESDFFESGRVDQVVDHGRERGSHRPEGESGTTTGRDNAAATSPSVASPGVSGAQPVDSGSGISAGTQLGDVSTARTGDEATDRLISLYDKATSKLASEAMSRAKKQQAEDEAAGKKRMLSDRKAISALFGLLDKVSDPNSRNREVKNFSQAVGVAKFEVAFHDPSKKRPTIQRTLTAEELQNPKIIRKITNYSAQNYDVFVRPAADSGGAILLQGLSAADVEKLEAIGLQPAATVSAGGKLEAWIKVDQKLSADEQKALKQRLSEVVGVPQKGAGFGRLTGYSRGVHGVTLSSHSGQAAPAVTDLLQDIKAEILASKMAPKIEQIVVTRAQLDAQTFVDMAGIKTLQKGWFRATRDEIEGDLARSSIKTESVMIEDKLLQAMARQKVPVSQAYSAVFAESRVANTEAHAALSVSQAYTRVALEGEGKKLAGIDIEQEARERFPELTKLAESGVEAERKAMEEQSKREAQEEQARLEDEAEERRLNAAMEAAIRAAKAKEDELKKG